MKTTNTFIQLSKYLFLFVLVCLFSSNSYAGPGKDTKISIKDLKLKLNGEALIMFEKMLSDNHIILGQTFTVTQSGDESDEDLNDGIFFPKTFRSALENADLTTDIDIIDFDQSLTIINAQTSLSDLIANEPIWIDGTIANNGKIIIDGSNDWQFALWIVGGSSFLFNVIMRNFPSGGLVVQGDGNIVQGCEIYQNGGAGMNMFNVSNNIIGGDLPSERNIIYGNTGNSAWGISIHGEQNNSNTIEGNWIGTSDGVVPAGNQKKGIRIDNGTNNIITNNVICDNDGGIDIFGDQLDGILIEWNRIGTDTSGTIGIGNKDGTGIFVFEGDNIQIKDNLISKNFNGIGIMSGATHVTIENNLIGTDITGNLSLGNTLYGILNRSDSIIISGNLISGNFDNGIQQYLGSGGEIKSNIIGTNLLGTQKIGNFGYGIRVVFATGVIIGGDSLDDGNVISGNWKSGIYLSANSDVGSTVKNNYIGTDFFGNVELGNVSHGILISRGSSNNKIISNLISGNLENGILIKPENGLVPQNNEIQKNYIGTNNEGISAIGNLEHGIVIDSSANNKIGGEEWNQGNLISGNKKNGIVIEKIGSTENMVQNNYIGTSYDSKDPVPNLFDGILILDAPNNIIGGLDEEGGNIISGNKLNGVFILGSNSTNNGVYGNKIGVDSTGLIEVGNKIDGIGIIDAGQNKIGAEIEGWGNLISNNDSIGIYIEGSQDGNTIKGNKIIANNEGIVLFNTSGNYIGDNNSDFGNVIGLNNKDGITIESSNDTASNNNIIIRNAIGLGMDYLPMPNGRDGIYIYGGNENQIMWNKIGNNQEVGINIETGVSNTIYPNEIFYNGLLGIDLNNDGVTINDEDDLDEGANNLQNFPVINNAYAANIGFLTIEGNLFSSSNTDFNIVFWYNDDCDSSGYGEGEYFLGTETVTTGNDGIIYFSFTYEAEVAVGKFITATATNMTDESTSEFCLCKTVDNPVDIAEYSDPGFATLVVNSVYPNPFANYTDFNYSIKENANVKLDIYDLKGNYVSNLIDNKHTISGDHTYRWKPTLNSGQYIYLFTVNGRTINGKIQIFRSQ